MYDINVEYMYCYVYIHIYNTYSFRLRLGAGHHDRHDPERHCDLGGSTGARGSGSRALGNTQNVPNSDRPVAACCATSFFLKLFFRT